jgi:cyclohexadieny/prephenate dehydrogenase
MSEVLTLMKRETPLFSRLTIIGMGLIGSSLARAARAANIASSIVAVDASKSVRLKVSALELVDEIYADPAQGVRNADAVILCVPVGACALVAEAMKDDLMEGVIVSDVGSVKHTLVQNVMPHLPSHAHFIPAHPVAGTEHSGPEAGFATLFMNRWCILTPLENTSETATTKIRQMWEAFGSLVEEMTPQHHDLVLAITSHVPHLIAYNIVGTAADLEKVTQSEVIKFSAGGFRDFTRIASSDPIMWRDVFLNNREAVLEDLATLAKAIRWGDGAMLEDFFTRSRSVRRGIVQLGQAGEREDAQS